VVVAAAVNTAPLILTLAMDEPAFDWFDDLRRRWFPPERNRVPAHLTLFHNLPGAELDAVQAVVRAMCAATGPMTLQVCGPHSLGRGVAYRLHSPELAAFRAVLADAFDPWLTPQDRQGFRPHVTVQNKVEPDEARLALEQLQAEFEPFDVLGEGVCIWRYLGGPWEALDRIAFTG
jgi:2'-5' RNA ligase